MKKLVLLLTPLLVLSLLLVAVGCGEEEATPTPTPAPTPTATATPAPTPTPAPKPEGHLRVALSEIGTENLDPLYTNTYMKPYLSLMYDWLVGADLADGMPSTETGIANKWEHSADYRSWTFYLRQGVKFHNGDEVTAEDVKFSLENLATPNIRAFNARLISGNIESIVIEDPYKLTIHTKVPSVRLIYDLSADIGNEGIVTPKNYIEANGRDYFRTHPVGSGPYRFVEQKVGSHVTLEATDYHFQMGVPKYKNITVYKIPEEITRVAMLKRGDADIIDVSRQQGLDLKKQGFNTFNGPREGISLDLTQLWEAENPLSDLRVREALELAIDKQAILDYIFLGQGEIIGAADNPFTIGYVPFPVRPYDPERAKQLLAEAGYPDRWANPTMSMPSYVLAGAPELVSMVEAIASYWKKVGVAVKIEPMDYSTYRAKQMAFEVVNSAFPQLSKAFVWPTDPRTGLSSKGVMSKWRDPEMDAKLDVIMASDNEADFIEGMQWVNRFNYDNITRIPIAQVLPFFATQPEIKEWDVGMVAYNINLRGVR